MSSGLHVGYPAFFSDFNPLNVELNPVCRLLALLGAHHIFHVSGLRVNETLTLSAIFENRSKIKFHENPSSGSRVVPPGKTEERTRRS